MKPIIKYDDTDLYLTVANYQNNSRMYLGLEDVNHDPYADITVNLPYTNEISKNIVYLNTDMSNELKETLRKSNLFGDTLMYQPYNYGNFEVVEVNIDKVKELCPEEYQQFETYYQNYKQGNSIDDLER